MNNDITIESINIGDSWDEQKKCIIKSARVQFKDKNKKFDVSVTLDDKDTAELITLCAKYISQALTHKCDDVLKSFKQFADKISEQEK